ncbi:MAG: hypothetical protein HQM12_20195 [SAR324 cluster bacterium]|nr:hypothetical protein [SAR324 cluster bacterium]
MFVKTILLVVAIALGFWLLRSKKKHLFQRYKPPVKVITQIRGSRVAAYLGLDTPLECLMADETRFGESFRLKQLSQFPHGANCRCSIQPISFSSTEVFEGALRTQGGNESEVGFLSSTEASALKKMLLGLYSHPLPLTFEMFCQQFDFNNIEPATYKLMVELIKKGFDRHQAETSGGENL